MEMKRTDELIKWLDDKDERKGIAETVSDITINLVVTQFAKRAFPKFPEWAQKIVNKMIDDMLDSEEVQTKDGGDPGQGPSDPRDDE